MEINKIHESQSLMDRVKLLSIQNGEISFCLDQLHNLMRPAEAA